MWRATSVSDALGPRFPLLPLPASLRRSPAPFRWRGGRSRKIRWPPPIGRTARCRCVKIATFNINNVVKRLDNLLAWLEREAPEVACLQELKTEHRAFPAEALAEVGYAAVWRGERTWNGVAILAKAAEPVLTRSSLPGDEADGQARYVEAAVNGVLVGCLYAPNGNPQPGRKFDYKNAWLERLSAHAATLIGAGVPAVLCGDFNVVPTDADIYSPKSWRTDALLQPRPRALFRELLAQGWTDGLREVCGERTWTFWAYLRQAWERDAGLRIDHLLVSPVLAGRVVGAGVDRWVRGEANASDHAPAWVEVDV